MLFQCPQSSVIALDQHGNKRNNERWNADANFNPNAIWSGRLKPLLGLPVVVGAVEANDEDVRVVDEVVRVFVAVTVAGISSVGGKGKERAG
jgi:hypothetical protein